jgi:aspartate/methionine/tyrosine aminotransferase
MRTVRFASRVARTYRPDGALSVMEVMGQIYPAFGAVFRDVESRAQDEAALADGSLLDLGIGRYGPTHPAVVEAAVASLRAGCTRYLDLYDLKVAVAIKYRDEHHVIVDATSQILLLGGARAGIMLSFLALVDAGDTVVVPDPDYLGLAHAAVAAGGRVVRPPLRREADGRLVPDVDVLVDAISSGAVAVALTNPGNPTGHVWTAAELDAVLDASDAAGAMVVVNEIYDRLVIDGSAHRSLAAAAVEGRAILIGGTAKCYDMTGFGLGWVVSSAPVIAQLADLRFMTHQAEPSAVAQHAALAALSPPVRDDHPRAAVEVLRTNAAATVAALASVDGVRCPFPAAGQFAFPYVGGDDIAVAKVLKQEGVCVIPGAAWGSQGRGHIRVALANPADEQAEGLARLRAGLRVAVGGRASSGGQ